MSLDALRDLIPAYARDIAQNLGSVMDETILNDQQKWGCFLASAHAIGVAPVVRAVESHATTVLSPEDRSAAKSASSFGAKPNSMAAPARSQAASCGPGKKWSS